MLTFSRRPDWPERLLFAIAQHQAGTFQWGQYDCGTLFSDCVYAMTGHDPMEELGRWVSERSAMRCLVQSGHSSIKSFLDARLPAITPSDAGRGDIGYTAAYGPLTCPAVVVGAEAMSRDEQGWIMMPVSKLVTAYRIG